jgi:DNA-directed RNA polymerase sigma subunit (sigma70/sigma32)
MPHELAEWLRDMGRYPMLTPDEVKTIALKMKGATTEINRRHWRDKLVKGNFRLVVCLVKKYKSKTEWLDLVQAGNIGLIRVPFHWQEKSSAVKKTVKTLIQTLGRSPSIPEIAKYMGKEISWVEEVLLHGRPIASLNFQFKGEGEELLSLVSDADTPSASDIIDRSIMSDRLYSVINSLVEIGEITHEEMDVLVRFYGLHGAPIETLKQQALGNERERARLQKVKNKAVAQLRTFPVRRQLTHLI